MQNRNKPLEVERTFGMGVLLKLTKKNSRGIEISSDGDKFISNVSLAKLSEAVDATLESLRIKLKF